MRELIEKIHQADGLVRIIELGCGSPVTNALCKIPGASNTLYSGFAPYSKNVIRETYGIPENQRFVSEETIDRILGLTPLTDGVSLVYASTFQVGPGCSTHGFIGVKDCLGNSVYHISIHEDFSRKEFIDRIGEIGIRTIYDCLCESIKIPHVDQVSELGQSNHHSNIIYMMQESSEGIVAFYTENVWESKRLETLLRKPPKGLIIYKGSFNPLTKAHVALMEEAQKQYPDYDAVYCVSSNTFDKTTDLGRFRSRISRLLSRNQVKLLVTNEPTFHRLIEVCHRKAPDKHLVFPMGYDTWERLYRDHEYSDSNMETIPATFLVSPRNGKAYEGNAKNVSHLNLKDTGISSTMIREKLLRGEDVSEYLA